MFRTSNPTLNNDAFKASQTWEDVYGPGEAGANASKPASVSKTHMTVSGVVQKSSFLIGLTVLAGAGAWHLTLPESAGGMGVLNPMVAWIASLVVGLPLLLVASFKPQLSMFCAPPYAAVQGLFAGSFSATIALWLGSKTADDGTGGLPVNEGIVLNAMALTMAIFVGMLGAYGTKLIRPGKVFYAVVITGTIGACLYGLVAMLLHFTGISSSLASVYDPSNGGLISIGFSVFLVGLASLNLVLDFDQISIGERNKAPKYMEWYSSMALLVTLVWLYIEVLRLVAKLQSRE